MNTTRTSRPDDRSNAEQGYMLLGLIVAIALIMLWLTVAAPPVVRNLRRDREVEAVHRGRQYVRAVREYYLKFQHYPGSMEQLEKTNNIRFLRQRYVNPIDGKDDWRTIAVGTNKTTVKGFFGEPLAGIATAGLGSAAGMQSTGISPAGGTSTGGFGGGAVGAILGAISASGPTNTAAPGATTAAGSTGTPGATGPTGNTSSGFGSPASAGISGGSAPFMGIGLNVTGDSIITVNEQTSYDTWEFLYDPRIEILKQKAALNGGAGSIGAGSLGQTPGAIGAPGAPNPTGTSPFGTTAPGGTPPAAPVVGVPVQQ